jgi:glycosyltransferase involved in cell wall biosynthesis
MYKDLKVAVVVPAYNEELLIRKTVDTLPEIVDHVIVVNDASTDNTLHVLQEIASSNKRVSVIDNAVNGGIGFSLKTGFAFALEHTDADAIGIVSGDAQCDPSCIQPMLEELASSRSDYVKGNRFFQRDALKAMPPYRRIGNIFISLLTKFATGFYSVSDITMGFGFFRRGILERVSYDLVKDRYDYEISMLVALSIASARIKDHAVPAIYGDETSTINFWPTVFRVLRVAWVGFWQRIYYKYILFSLHPIAIFIFGGLILSTVGFGFGVYVLVEKSAYNLTPSTGTVMLSALPLLLGFQLLMTALTMDVYNDRE